MSIVRINPEFVENTSLEVNMQRTFAAAGFDPVADSYTHVTGSVFLYTRRPDGIKDAGNLSAFIDVAKLTEGGSDTAGLIAAAKDAAVTSGSNFDEVRGLLTKVGSLDQSRRLTTSFDVIRRQIGYTFDRNTVIKRQIRELLYPYYRTTHPSYHWAYTNYNSLNFFTGSSDAGGVLGVVPHDTVLMYPNTRANLGVAGNTYLPQGPFSFDFRINPRYTTPNEFDVWQNGTLFHMSGVYAVSLLTGSHRDVNGLPDTFRLALQVASGTYTLPSEITGQANSVFLSDDNVLRRGDWHHVVIRWGTDRHNFGTGSFVVDGNVVGQFNIPSASLYDATNVSQDILYVGNFYEGPHTGSNTQNRFFTTTVAGRDGLAELQTNPSTGDIDRPMGALFRHPLNAEVHELRIWNEHLNDDMIHSMSSTSPTDMSRLLFYVPPFFMSRAPTRAVVNGVGGVLQTPFNAINATTNDPFNVALSFGVGALYINLENFTMDFANTSWPRAYNLTASVMQSTSDSKTAVDFLYTTGNVRKRNLTILPCDDGQFTPDFAVVQDGMTGSIPIVPTTASMNFNHANDLGVYDPSLVRLSELIPSTSFYSTLLPQSGTIFSSIVGATPDDPGVDPGEVLTVFQRTRDNSSNEVSIFDVSNLFYDRRVKPNSVVIRDLAVTGSGGRVGITLRDNGYGSLYRADANTRHATWASVGNVIYDEGLIVIKTPHLPYFGRDGFDIEFRGSHRVHTYRVRVPAEAGLHTSSSNTTFAHMSASMAVNDHDRRFVYITGINLHDENMNVVMKTTVAQPIIKRSGDRIVFRINMDY